MRLVLYPNFGSYFLRLCLEDWIVSIIVTWSKILFLHHSVFVNNAKYRRQTFPKYRKEARDEAVYKKIVSRREM